MSFEHLIRKILSKWWLIALITLLFSIIFFPSVNRASYLGSISVGANFNHPSFIERELESTRSEQYSLAMTELSKYITSRFESVEVQIKISSIAGLGVQSFEPEEPFYEVVAQNGGFVSISYQNRSKQKVENFLQATKEVYQEILAVEMGENVLDEFKVIPQVEFVEAIQSVDSPPQIKLLPIITGVMLGILVTILLPYKTAK